MLDGAGALIGVMALDIAEGQVQGTRSIVNPDKLGHLGPVSTCARPWTAPPASAAGQRPDRCGAPTSRAGAKRWRTDVGVLT
jgi:hypothetical protein